MKNTILIIVLFLFATYSYAQSDSSFWNPEMTEIAERNSVLGWIRLKRNIPHNVQSFFAINKRALGLQANDEMEPFESDTDALGFLP